MADSGINLTNEECQALYEYFENPLNVLPWYKESAEIQQIHRKLYDWKRYKQPI